MSAPSPFDDLLALLNQLPPGNYEAADTKLESIKAELSATGDGIIDLIYWLATWQDAEKPSISDSHICLLASTYTGHEGNETIKQLIKDASTGKTAINALCVKEGVGLRVLELAPELPHDTGKDWPEAECMAAVAFGMEATAAGGNLLGLSDIAPGNDIVAQSILSKLSGMPNASAIDKLTLLRLHGGREIAAMLGALIAARSRRLPVLIEGWGALTAYLTLYSISPTYVDHAKIAAFQSSTQFDICEKISTGVKPVLNQYIDVGVGCGIALSVTLISGAIALLD